RPVSPVGRGRLLAGAVRLALRGEGWQGTTVAQALARLGQSSEARARFWYPLAIATLNEVPEAAAAAPFAAVVRRGFLAGARAARFALATVPLSELYTTDARRAVAEAGGGPGGGGGGGGGDHGGEGGHARARGRARRDGRAARWPGDSRRRRRPGGAVRSAPPAPAPGSRPGVAVPLAPVTRQLADRERTPLDRPSRGVGLPVPRTPRRPGAVALHVRSGTDRFGHQRGPLLGRRQRRDDRGGGSERRPRRPPGALGCDGDALAGRARAARDA